MSLDAQTELLREMRDLLRIMAEPAIAERDKKLRAELRRLVGKSKKSGQAVFLMDGTRKQSAICKAAGVDQGFLSRFIKSLRSANLVTGDENPTLAIAIPSNFFDQSGETQ